MGNISVRVALVCGGLLACDDGDPDPIHDVGGTAGTTALTGIAGRSAISGGSSTGGHVTTLSSGGSAGHSLLQAVGGATLTSAGAVGTSNAGGQTSEPSSTIAPTGGTEQGGSTLASTGGASGTSTVGESGGAGATQSATEAGRGGIGGGPAVGGATTDVTSLAGARSSGGEGIAGSTVGLGSGGQSGIGSGSIAGGGLAYAGEGGAFGSGGDAGSSGQGTEHHGCGDALCVTGQKHCNGYCHSIQDPSHGCGSESCNPCKFDHAVPKCSEQGVCAIAACLPGWADCDEDLQNGCETDITRPAACQACNVHCSAGQYCAPSGCVASCTPPLTKCGDRCSNLMTDPGNCGDCNSICPTVGAGMPVCNQGSCGVGTCQMGAERCGNSCIDTRFDPNNCGTCGNFCPRPRSFETVTTQVFQVACNDGVCGPACWKGHSLCGDYCVALGSDAQNCGACGNICPSNQSCVGGVCKPADTIISSLSSAPVDLAVDYLNLYWIDSSSVSVIPKQGGSPVQLATGQAMPTHLAVDAEYVYWTNNLGAAVMRTLTSGAGQPELVAAATKPAEVMTVGGLVVWRNDGDNTLRKAPKSGDSNGGTILASAVRKPITDGISVYGLPDSGYIVRIDPISGAREDLVDLPGNSGTSIWTNSLSLFWITGTMNRSVNWRNIASGAESSVLMGLWRPTGPIVADSCAFYTAGRSTVEMLELATTIPMSIGEQLFPESTSPMPLALDESYIYWGGTSEIGRIAIPR